MTSKEYLSRFLQGLADFQRQNGADGIVALLLEKGTWFEGRCSSDDYESTKKWRKDNRPKGKECFHNAQLICTQYLECRYFEGYACTPPILIPIPHAWIVLPDDKVVDLTLEAAERSAKRDGHTLETADTVYVGLEVPTDYVRRTMVKARATEPLAARFYDIGNKVSP